MLRDVLPVYAKFTATHGYDMSHVCVVNLAWLECNKNVLKSPIRFYVFQLSVLDDGILLAVVTFMIVRIFID